MTISSLGDLAQTLILRRQQTSLKAEMQVLSQESTTGISSDTAARLNGNVAPLAAIESSLTRLGALGKVTAQMALGAEGMQSALETIGGLATGLGPQLLVAGKASGNASTDALGADARQRFTAAVSALNTRLGDRSLFAGTAGDGPAMSAADDILAALSAAIAGATTAAGITTAVSGWFDDPAGYGATAYRGGPGRGAVTIAPGETAALSVTANDPAIRDVLKGLAMAALLDTGALAGNPAARAGLAVAAGEKLAEAETGRAYLAARIGRVEAQIEAASTRNGAEATALKIARSGLISVDPYESATRIDEAEAQLNMLYALTARMGKMSLVGYL